MGYTVQYVRHVDLLLLWLSAQSDRKECCSVQQRHGSVCKTCPPTAAPTTQAMRKESLSHKAERLKVAPTNKHLGRQPGRDAEFRTGMTSDFTEREALSLGLHCCVGELHDARNVVFKTFLQQEKNTVLGKALTVQYFSCSESSVRALCCKIAWSSWCIT